MNAQEKIVGTDLTQIAEYTQTALALATLKDRFKNLVVDLSTKKGLEAATKDVAELRTLRTSLEKRRKELKEPLITQGKLLDDEAKRLTAEISALEDPLKLQVDAKNAEIENVRLQKLETERLRVEAIQKKIQAIRDVPGSLVGKPSVIIAGQLAKLRETALDEAELGADYITATDALTAAIVRVEQLLVSQQEADAEKKRQAERDAEMEAMRVKMAEQQQRIDEAEEAKRVEQERLAQVERDRAMAEERARQAAEQAARDEAARIEREDQERVRAEQAEVDRIAREAREEAARIEREYEIEQRREAEEKLRIETARVAELERDAARAKKEAAAKAEAERLANLGLREAAQAAVKWFCWKSLDKEQVAVDLAASLANDEAQAKPARTKRVARG
jgi:hypothetical protein